MRYRPRPVQPMQIEAVFLDDMTTLLEFLQVGEFSTISREGAYLVLEDRTTIYVEFGTSYLIRWPHGLDVMSKDDFESTWEEAR